MKKRREHLIEVRKENKMFQKDVVKMLKSEFNIEISESYYGMIEQGTRTPSLEIAMAISEIFGKKVEDIFFIR